MVEIISLFIFFILLVTYLHFLKKRNRKYSDSRIFYIIEREYMIWYSKKENGSVINKKIASMFEIDKAIYGL